MLLEFGNIVEMEFELSEKMKKSKAQDGWNRGIPDRLFLCCFSDSKMQVNVVK